MIIQEPVQASIWFALNYYAYDDAIFLAERLHSELGSDETLYLLATCYYRASKPIAAYKILTKTTPKSSECRLLLAKCCCDLKKYEEAEKVLMYKCRTDKKSTSKTSLSIEELIAHFNESASFASQLLGLIYSKTEQVNKATEYYKKSLKINAFLWSSFEKLIQLGFKPDSSKIFDINNVDFNLCHGFNALENLSNLPKKSSSTSNNNFSTPLAIDKTTTLSEQSRLSFGILPSIGSTETPLSSIVPIPNLILDHDSRTPTSNFITNMIISSNNCSTGNSPLTITSVPGKISRAPIKKPQTRRGQQSSNLGLHNPTSRNLASKLQLVNTVNTQQLLENNNIYVNSTASTPNQNSTMQSLRRSSRLFNSSSVKENNTKTTRNINQENNNKKTLQTCSKTPTKRIKMSSNNSSTSLHKSSNNNTTASNTDSIVYQKNEKNLLITNQVSNEDFKQTSIKMQRASAEGLLNLLSVLGQAALAIGQFKCQHAITILHKLPDKHHQSGYVLTSIGRAYFEMGKYEEAVSFFEKARQSEPHILKGMEYYSTALWHLQHEVKLSSIAKELIDYDRDAPQTWCVAGNCFSLQKEHETAIKFLQRAIQVDTDFAYAYTLLGHEFVLTEEMDNALACFRNAIRIDKRHYNAHYGIGMIYYKQEKFQMAEMHYGRALNISPSPVLLCHLAVVQHALKKSDKALQTLNKAIDMDPKNALCKFHRASIKFSMDDYDSALKELDELKQIVPPKGANNQIKEVIDKQYPNEQDEQTIGSDPVVRNDSSTNSTDNSDNSLIRPHLSMSSSSDGMDEDEDS